MNKKYSCDFYNYLKLSQATVSQVISMSFWSLVASSDANNANSCRSLYGSWRIARYLDADNSFSVPCCLALLLLLHHLCTLCYSPCLLRVFLLFSSSVEQRLSHTILSPARFRRDARAYAPVFYYSESLTFFLSIFLFFPAATPRLTTLGRHVHDFRLLLVTAASSLPLSRIFKVLFLIALLE